MKSIIKVVPFNEVSVKTKPTYKSTLTKFSLALVLLLLPFSITESFAAWPLIDGNGTSGINVGTYECFVSALSLRPNVVPINQIVFFRLPEGQASGVTILVPALQSTSTA